VLSQTKCSNVQINLKQLKKWVNLISDLYFKTDSYLYFSNGIFQQFQLKRSCHSELNDKGENLTKIIVSIFVRMLRDHWPIFILSLYCVYLLSNLKNSILISCSSQFPFSTKHLLDLIFVILKCDSVRRDSFLSLSVCFSSVFVSIRYRLLISYNKRKSSFLAQKLWHDLSVFDRSHLQSAIQMKLV
jgi:hypothetical protein